MDGTRFDQLIKKLGTTRMTRLTALRGLAVGALAATIGSAEPDDVAARRRKCGQCKKKVRRRTNDGKVRIRCKKKANGTFCSLAGVASATCQEGSCVASAAPVPQPLPPAPPGFDCRRPGVGCTGQFAGLICDAATGQCVFCQNFTQCGGRVCAGGRCRGFEPCNNNTQCAGILPAGFDGLICNDDNENPEAPDDVCIFEPCDYPNCQVCDEDSDCDYLEFNDVELVCVLNQCVQSCLPGEDPCDDGYGGRCEGGLCLRD